MIDEGCFQFDRQIREVIKGEVNVITIPYKPAMIQVLVKKPPITITLPGPVPYHGDREVPCRYGAEVSYQDSKHEIESPNISNPKVNDVVGTSRIT